jgi:hypothetical protein
MAEYCPAFTLGEKVQEMTSFRRDARIGAMNAGGGVANPVPGISGGTFVFPVEVR